MISELSGKEGQCENHHIFPRGSHPKIKKDKRNKFRLLIEEHKAIHSNKRKELTFQIFDIKTQDPKWFEWAKQQQSKLFVEWMDLNGK